jgi:hypothetical protein
MNDLEKWLKEVCDTESGPYLRPFSPNPNWYSADVIVVGTNPATPLRDQFLSFDEYWDALTRTPEKFEEVYSREHGGGESKTTSNRRVLTDNLNGINVLVTNVVWLPSSSASKIKISEFRSGYGRLKRLLDGINPKVIFAYGGKAVECIFNNYSNVPDKLTPPQQQGKSREEPLVLTFPHLSGQGLPPGTKFRPDEVLPEFAQIIMDRL